MKVESGLTDRDDTGLAPLRTHRVTERVVQVLGVMRVYAHRRRDPLGMRGGDVDGRAQRVDVLRAADGDDTLHARISCSREHVVELLVKPRVVEVAVRVEQHGAH